MAKRAFLFGCLLLAASQTACQSFAGLKTLSLDWEKATLREAPEASFELTLYQDNWALVTDERPLELGRGRQLVRFSGVPPQTVAKGAYLQVPASVEGRRFRYDLPNKEHLLEKYDGKTVVISDATSSLTAQLIWTGSGPVYRIGDRLYPEPPGKVSLPELPGIALSPFLEWLIDSPREWAGIATASYEVERLGWTNEYTLITDEDQSKGDWKQWAALSNASGKAYEKARVNLVAGNVKRFNPPVFYGGARAMTENISAEPFAARYQYRLPGFFDLGKKAAERLSLFEKKGAAIERVFRVAGSVNLFPVPDPELPRKARIRLNLDVPQPMPSGKVTVYSPGPDGKLAIAGETGIPDTPKNQRIVLDLGEAFDVTFTRTQTSYKLLAEQTEVSTLIKLKNDQKFPVKLEVIEQVSGDWTVTESAIPYEKLSTTQLRFQLVLPAESEKNLTYTVVVKREGRL
ncbi:MAG TPA: hypothetical protein V6C82_00995 [Chroococcales cyanobacterium]